MESGTHKIHKLKLSPCYVHWFLTNWLYPSAFTKVNSSVIKASIFILTLLWDLCEVFFFFWNFFLSEEAVAYLCQRDYYTSTVFVCLFLKIISPSNNLHLKGFFNGNKNSWLIFRKFFFWMQKVFFKNHSWPYDFYIWTQY